MEKASAVVKEVLPVTTETKTSDNASEDISPVAPTDKKALVLDKEIPDASSSTIVSSVKLLHSALVFFEGNRNLFDTFATDITAMLDSKTNSSDGQDSDTSKGKNFTQRLDALKSKADLLMLQLEVYGEVITQVTNNSLLLLDQELVPEDDESKLEDYTHTIARDMCLVTHSMNDFSGKFNVLVNAFIKLKKEVELFCEMK